MSMVITAPAKSGVDGQQSREAPEDEAPAPISMMANASSATTSADDIRLAPVPLLVRVGLQVCSVTSPPCEW